MQAVYEVFLGSCLIFSYALLLTPRVFFVLFCFIKAGWKESHATFMTELRNLQANGLTTFGQSLRTSFDLLNLNRLVTGIDNYGQVCSSEEAEEVRFSLKEL